MTGGCTRACAFTYAQEIKLTSVNAGYGFHAVQPARSTRQQAQCADVLRDGHGDYRRQTNALGTDSDLAMALMIQACGLSKSALTTARVLDVAWSHPLAHSTPVYAKVLRSNTIIALPQYDSCDPLQAGPSRCVLAEDGDDAQLPAVTSGDGLVRFAIFELDAHTEMTLTFQL